MSLMIESTEDSNLLARLNKDVQMLHHHIEPNIFKAYNHSEMTVFFKHLLEEGSKAYVAYENEQPSAYILITIKHQAENAFKKSYSVLSIDQVCVESAFKGKGIGKALIDHAKQLAQEAKIDRLEMNYWTANENSGQFFRAQGFKNYNERLAFTIGDNS